MDTAANRKILFLDIDDTLLTTDKKVTPENQDAIRRVLAAGHKVVITSGRPLSAIIRVAEEVHLADPGCFIIAYNGAQIYDCEKGVPIYSNALSLEDVEFLFREADKLGLHMQTYDSKDLLVREYNKEAQFYNNKIGMTWRVVPELPAGLTERPVKTLAIDLDHTDRQERLRETIHRTAGDRLSAFMSNAWYLECVNKGISKGFGIRWLSGHLGIPIENSVSAGDSENDLPMIREAHIGCAMANASDECKEAADYVTERDCNHSGVAEIIERFIL